MPNGTAEPTVGGIASSGIQIGVVEPGKATTSAANDGSEQKGSRAPRASRGSSFGMSYGRRAVKAYPVTDADLRSIGAFGTLVTVAFSLGTGLLGFALDLTKDISLGSEATGDFWNAIRWSAAAGVVVFYAIGGILAFVRHSNIDEIKKNTTFD